MESIQRERCEDGLSRLGVPIFQRHLSTTQSLKVPDLSSNSSVCKISDETLPYTSTFFDDTIDPSTASDVPGATPGLPDHSHLIPLTKTPDVVISGLRSQTKPADSSWLNAPVSVDFSMSIASPHNDTKDATKMNETNLKEGASDSNACVPDSTARSEKNAIRGGSKNSTFDMTQGFKEKSSGSDSTISLPSVRTESNNITFEKTQELKEFRADGLSSSVSPGNATLETGQEKHINSTVDICVPSNTTTEQPNEKLDHTVDISQLPSNVPRQEQCNEGLASGEDCEKSGTFTKTSEETSVDSAAYVEQNCSASPHGSTDAGETSPANQQPVDRTFTKHNTTTDLKSAGPLSNLKNAGVNTTVNVVTDTELQGQSDAGAAVDDAPLARPSPQLYVSTVSVTKNAEEVVCSDRSLDLLDAESKGEESRGLFKRRNGISEQECHLNLDISHSSLLSLDDTLDMKSRALVTSTPIVLGRDFNRLRCAKPAEMQKRLSVINSIGAQSNDDLVGEHDGSSASPTKPEACSQTQNNPAKCTSGTSTSESAVVNQPASKIVVRRKIPQPSCKSNIPKSQILPRPPTSQPTSMVVKSKTVPTTQASNQPETSSYALRSMKRPVQLNKGKNLAPAKNAVTAGTVRTSAVSASASECALTADSKPSNTMMQPKPSGLQPPGRGRFGLKPPGAVVSSAENGQSQTNNKPTGLSGMRTRSSLLPGFPQKHASSDALPLAKRKKYEMQDQITCAETATSSKPGGGTQRPVTAPKDIKPKKANADCGSCTLLKQKLNTFHRELGRFLQELEGCENWLPFQQKFEMCLEEFKRLQADHHQRRGTQTGP